MEKNIGLPAKSGGQEFSSSGIVYSANWREYPKKFLNHVELTNLVGSSKYNPIRYQYFEVRNLKSESESEIEELNIV